MRSTNPESGASEKKEVAVTYPRIYRAAEEVKLVFNSLGIFMSLGVVKLMLLLVGIIGRPVVKNDFALAGLSAGLALRSS